jgi:BASS family bile acid:Na+ symporter
MQGDIVSSVLLPLILAFIMFSLGLGLTPDDFPPHLHPAARACWWGWCATLLLLPLACFACSVPGA